LDDIGTVKIVHAIRTDNPVLDLLGLRCVGVNLEVTVERSASQDVRQR